MGNLLRRQKVTVLGGGLIGSQIGAEYALGEFRRELANANASDGSPGPRIVHPPRSARLSPRDSPRTTLLGWLAVAS
ncbi:MAG TPA: hypothetical protein DEV93_22150 [Chloroflexi bacterium]|jgi:hypothetical protein|nr:hypothetical protein [Chloroflexota bacterium]